MQLQKIRLRGYKRLALTEMYDFEVQFQSLFQILLGTNGSGKSSLLKELSPLPAHPSQFQKGGIKDLTFTHGGCTYRAVSDFTGKAHHQLYKDEEPLNDNGSISVQRQIVEQEFGLTDDIWALMVGDLRFTQLTPAKRREIITKISDHDLTYALRVYQQIASQARDLQGAVKHTHNRITEETERLQSLGEEALKEEVEQIQQELTVLMEHRRTDLESQSAVEERLTNELDQARQLSEAILTKTFVTPDAEQFPDMESLEAACYQRQSTVESKKQTLKTYSHEHEQLHRLVGKMDANEVDSMENLQTRVKEITDRINELEGKIQCFTFAVDAQQLYAHSNAIRSELITILTELPSNANREYSREYQNTLEQKLQQAKRRLAEVRSTIERDQTHLKEHEGVESIECPKCQHRWQPGVEESMKEQLKKRIAEYEEGAKKLEQYIEKTQETLKAIEAYQTQRRRLSQFPQQYPGTEGLLDAFVEDNRIDYQPHQLVGWIDAWIEDLSYAVELQDLYRKQKTLGDSLEQAQSLNTDGRQQLHQTLDQMEKRVDETTTELREAENDLKALREHHEHAKIQQKRSQALQDLFTKIQQDQERLIEAHRNEKLQALIQQHQTTLALKSQKLKDRETIESTLASLEKDLQKLERDHQGYQMLAKALSPQDGIIADSMGAFIDAMVEQMNQIIEQVYTYPLRVESCNVDGADLDYKFPFRNRDHGEPIADINEGSMGQKEIIDFAFKIVSLMYLDFKGWPLFLDEPGHQQDEQHLANIMSMIKWLVESGRHSQLFMVSHFAAGYGSFHQADVLVLNAANVTVPARHNEHLTHFTEEAAS